MYLLKNTKKSRNNIKKFKNKKFNYKKYVKDFYIENGKAHVHANVSCYEDIISKYSVEGYEFLNQDFIDYMEEVTYYIPVEYPVILEISGCKFTEKEEEIIADTILYYFGLQLSDADIDLKENMKSANLILIISLVLMGLLYLLNQFNIIEVFLEAYLIIFWFFLWTYAELIVTDRSKLKINKLDMGQLASMKILFKH